MKFAEFIEKILIDPAHVCINFQGQKKYIKAMVKLTSNNYPENEYLKIRFKDDSFMLVLLNEKEVYFDQYIFIAKGIKDDQIGQDKVIKYQDKSYRLGNKDDYQFVLELIYGSPLEIEGECRFSDYFPVSGKKEFLSLGWLSRTGKRADIHCKIIDLKDISSSS